jgi:hypothetical protein
MNTAYAPDIQDSPEDWVMCRLVVCTPLAFLNPANDAVLRANDRILQDPVLGEIASVDVFPYTNQVDPQFEGVPTPARALATAVQQFLVASPDLSRFSKAPYLVFGLLIIGHASDAPGLATELAGENALAGLPILYKEFTDVDAVASGSSFGADLEREILQLVTESLELAEDNGAFRVAPSRLRTHTLGLTSDVPVQGNRQASSTDGSGSAGGWQEALSKARSQLTAWRTPSAVAAIDQASLRENSIRLLYIVIVTGSTQGERIAEARWGEIARRLTQRIAAIEAGSDENAWYVSFLSAGEGVDRVGPPRLCREILRRHVSTKQMGYDFEFLDCTRATAEFIQRDTASFARRGVPVSEVRTLFFSAEAPLADSDSLDGYRDLCDLSPVSWILSRESGEVSQEYDFDRSHVFIDHADIVEEVVTTEFH